jgi:tetratricopeptide (TPR) repeat protein
VDTADAHVDDADATRRPLLLEALRDEDAEPVVPAQDVPDAGDEHAHVEQDTRVDAAVAELEDRLQRYSAERYPVQRATALFHLGTLLSASDPGRARELLGESASLFADAGLASEEAKARNALGAALRALGEINAAAAAFRAAAAAFAGGSRERAAALFNLGLVTRDAAPLEEARELFAAGSREHAAARRELGVLHLERDDVEAAAAELAAALEAGDEAAANALGLARLAQGRVDEAAAAFRRSGDPMASANLALVYERAGDAARAREAALRALTARGAASAVRMQAAQVLARLGADIVSDDDAEAILRAVLELPTSEFEHLLETLLGARAQLERVAARFHLPQELRVRETLEALWVSRTT